MARLTADVRRTCVAIVRRCERSGPIAAARCRASKRRICRAMRRTARDSSRPSPITLRTETGSPNCTNRFRPLSTRESMRRKRPTRSQFSARSNRIQESSMSGARPQKTLTGIRSTSSEGSFCTAATRSRSVSGMRRCQRSLQNDARRSRKQADCGGNGARSAWSGSGSPFACATFSSTTRSAALRRSST